MALLNIHDFTIPANEIVEKASIRFIQILVKQRIPPIGRWRLSKNPRHQAMLFTVLPNPSSLSRCLLNLYLLPIVVYYKARDDGYHRL